MIKTPLRVGLRVLLLLYPPSWLGLTSPVGGITGQIALDGSGQIKSRSFTRKPGIACAAQCDVLGSKVRSAAPQISLAQLERAIRSAREE